MSQQITPPKFFQRLFKWFCDPDLHEELAGDIEEEFSRAVQQKGLRKAKAQYRREILLLIRPSVIKRLSIPNLIPDSVMFKNYLKIALRSLSRQLGYTLTNVIGLVLGLTACLLILLYIWDESRYDQGFQQGANIYRLNTRLQLPDQQLDLALAAGPTAPALQEAFPEVQSVVRLAFPWSNPLVKQGEQQFYEDGILYADSTFFEVFDFPLLAGNLQEALQAPFSLVITQEFAQKYFGQEAALGKQLTINDELYTVNGIIGKKAERTHLQADCYISFASWIRARPHTETNWTWTSFPTYLLLKPQTNIAAFNQKIATFPKERMSEEAWAETATILEVEAFSSIYFSAHRLGELDQKGSKTYLLFLGATAGFILIMALLNFVNLSTARASIRAKEIGVRKTVGAERQQLVQQFLMESGLLVFSASILALILTSIILPSFNHLIDRQLSLYQLPALEAIAIGLAACLLISLLAGLYPAFFLSSYSHAGLLKPSSKRKGASFWPYLSGFQFATSTSLIICTIVAWQQVQYLLHQDPGFPADRKIVLNFGKDTSMLAQLPQIREELLQLPAVEAVSSSSHIPSEGPYGVFLSVEEENGESRDAEIAMYSVDQHFLDLYELELLAGQNYTKLISTDSTAELLVNAATVELLGFESPEEIIGKEFYQWDTRGRVVGVVENFNFQSLHEEIGALSFQLRPPLFEKLTVQFSAAASVPATLAQLQRKWNELAGHLTFQYSFLDDRLEQQYEKDQRFASLSLLFSIVAIFIALLGLMALVGYSCRRKAKDIAVKKVFGASVAHIIWSLFQRFSQPVLWGWLLVIFPVYYLLNQWLNDFTYRIDISWLVLLGAGLIGMLLSFIAVFSQSFSTATANPTHYLKDN
ncbi:MAG: ABC transporter permease [Saprospiraceae bacterium]|nr:ABC transporter permease [Saprospiraceae bacterium]